jgi:alpha-amylase/alpha-mannosidase (GH57 family)
MKLLVIHGHFYQPPRENPWTGGLEREPSADPYHDWNERIHRECYRPNALAQIVDSYGHAERLVNNYTLLNFNFGPTLLSWMEVQDPVTYGRILEADRLSARARNGHGNAIAQAYNHAILPLCSERDRVTQVRWGISDFRSRFGRDPEALWMPETACNNATLGTLIDHGMKYAILSPYQAERVRPLGREEWTSVADGSIDPGIPYLYLHRDGSGRSIALFFYDGPAARSIAFEGALATSKALVSRLGEAGGGDGRLVHVATDGESYGHHTRFGDRTLAYALAVEAPARGFSVTNYGAFLEANPPTMEVEVKPGPNGEGTAWSCAHGVGRWHRDCGCRAGGEEEWNQAWRTPLRNAFDFLRDEVARHFANMGGDIFRDPWAARDAYIDVLRGTAASREEWLHGQAARPLSQLEQERALTLLEMTRNAMLTYTSCGWFFAEVSGIETVQVMKYAGRVLDLMDELDLENPRNRFLEILSEAQSNIRDMGNGADVFRHFVDPLRASPSRVAAHLGILGLVEEGEQSAEAVGYRFWRTSFRKQKHGRLSLATGRFRLEDKHTGKGYDYAVASIHFGGVDFYCVLKGFPGGHRFSASVSRLWSNFRTAPLPLLLRTLQEEFGPEEYGLESVLAEGRWRVSQLVFGDLVKSFADQYLLLYEKNQRVLEMLQEAGFELPKELMAAAEFTLGRRFEEEIRKAQRSRDPRHYQRAIEIEAEVERHGYRIDRSATSVLFDEMVAEAVDEAVRDPSAQRFLQAASLVDLARKLRADSDLDRAQEILYAALEGRPKWPEEIRWLIHSLGFSSTVSNAIVTA